jgi:hypothetical protein
MKNVGVAAANGGALSIDQAVEKLGEPPRKKRSEGTEDSAPGETETSLDPVLRQAQHEDGNDQDGDDGERADDAQDADGAELEPPKFWDAKAKERFADLPRDLQEIVLDKENERNQATAKALQDAAARRKDADTEASRFKSASDGLARFFPQAMNDFAHRWSNIDWTKVAARHGADHALKLQHQMQAEQRGLQRLSAAKELTDRLAHGRFVQEQEALVPRFAPELADPKDGRARREELGRFLTGLGVPPQQISRLSALEAGLAHDAMQWRNARAKADELLKAPREAAPPKRMPAKPAGNASRGGATHNRIAALSNKKSLTIDEAVELHNLKGLQ